MLLETPIRYRAFTISVHQRTKPTATLSSERLIRALSGLSLKSGSGAPNSESYARSALNYARRDRRAGTGYRIVVKHKALQAPYIYDTNAMPNYLSLRTLIPLVTARIKESRARSKPHTPKEPGEVLRKYKAKLARAVFEQKIPATDARYISVEIECIADRTHEVLGTDLFELGLSKVVQVKHDGSVKRTETTPERFKHPVEIVLCADALSFSQHLATLTTYLAEHATVNKTCGLHVHLDQRGRTMAQVAASFSNLVTSQKYLFAMVPESRKSNYYCKPNSSNVFARNRSDRYRMINAMAYNRHRTLEVRGHSGTIDYTKIRNWVALCSAICYADIHTKRALRSLESVFDRYRINTNLRRYVESRTAQFSPRQQFTQEASET